MTHLTGVSPRVSGRARHARIFREARFVQKRRMFISRPHGLGRATVLALSIRGCSGMSAHAGASPHWEKLWSQEGGLRPGSRFDVAGVSLPLAAEGARRALAPRSGMSALVPGCGRAYDAAFLAEHGFESVVALDLSPAACDAAREEINSLPSSTRSRVAVESGDFFELEGRTFDFIWDCTFLCALDPSVRERWAQQMRSLLADDGELLTCVFPIGQREGGPPYAMTVDLVRALLEPLGFEATLVQDRLPLEEQHRRPGDALESVLTRGTALVSWRVKAAGDAVGASAIRRAAGSTMSLSTGAHAPGPFIIDTDCGLDDLATLALAAAAPTSLRLVTTTSGLAPSGHGHLLARRTLDRVGLQSVPVVAGAETPPSSTVRRKQDWEVSYEKRVAEVTRAMNMETTFAGHLARRELCSAGAAADAIIDTARAAGGGTTILALGALTNLAQAVNRYPADFRQLVQRVVFIGDTDPSRQSYNAALDPAALKVVLGSGVEIVLVGSSCYPRPAWVEALFDESAMGIANDVSVAGGGDSGGTCTATSGASAAAALRALGSLDPYSMCYDPLALLFHLHPDAFTHDQTPTPVQVSGDTNTADGWRFERCPSDAQEEAHGYVSEPSAVSLDRYAAFLRQACSNA